MPDIPNLNNVVDGITPESVQKAETNKVTYVYKNDKINIREWTKYTMLLISNGFTAETSDGNLKTFSKGNANVVVAFPEKGSMTISVTNK